VFTISPRLAAAAAALSYDRGMKLPRRSPLWFVLSAALLWAVNAAAVPVRQLEIRIVIGAEELTPGSDLELRIYETSGIVRRLPVAHTEPWLPDSTHLIPLKLSEALEPRNVQRFSLYYRPGSPLAAPFEIIAADVELPSGGGEPQKLLGMTLSGVIARQGELATEDRAQAAGTCLTDEDCDDKRACNGLERCAPRSPGADARGCVKGTPVVCPVNQVCGEGIGCHGVALIDRDAKAAPGASSP
jgi:hypothetical protein